MKRLLLASTLLFLATPVWADNLNIKQTPDVYPPPVVGTSPCLVAGSLGVGITGFGIAGGTAVKDDGCEDRNYAEELAAYERQIKAQQLLARFREMDAAIQQARY